MTTFLRNETEPVTAEYLLPAPASLPAPITEIYQVPPEPIVTYRATADDLKFNAWIAAKLPPEARCTLSGGGEPVDTVEPLITPLGTPDDHAFKLQVMDIPDESFNRFAWEDSSNETLAQGRSAKVLRKIGHKLTTFAFGGISAPFSTHSAKHK